MTIWRLEYLRLVRTGRLLTVVGVYLFFGLTGPLSARYLAEIVARFGGPGVTVRFPTPRPVDGIAQFTGNASQLGLLTVVLVAASALAFDGRHEMAVFLRTRIPVRGIVLPAYAMNVVAAVTGLLLGTVAAWYETAVLLGAPEVGALLAGTAFAALFLAFAVALTAVAAAVTRNALGAAGITVGILLLAAVAGAVRPLAHWLPTSLGSAAPALLRGGRVLDYLPAAVVAVVGIAGCLGAAVALNARHES